MRVVFDTNVLLAAMFTRGLCEALVDDCLGPKGCEVVLSQYILDEFNRQAVAKFGAPGKEARGAVEFLRKHVELVEPANISPDSCRDADDLAVLGTAVAAGADCLVTGDHDLLDLKEFAGIAILSPRALHDLLGRKSR